MSKSVNTHPDAMPRWRKITLMLLRSSVILLSIGLIAYISYDTLRRVSILSTPDYRSIQLATCILFQIEIMAELILSPPGQRHWTRNIAFALICIPYLTLLHHWHIPLRGEVAFMMQFLPLLRAGYIMALIWGLTERNWISGMFMTYIIMLVATVYFLSLMFFVIEHPVNPSVTSYWDALWYSVMQLNTTGSSINPATPSGKIIGLVLSIEGLVLIPVFTVYLTHAFVRTRASKNASLQ